MTPRPPSKISIATETARALLATKLVDIFPKAEKKKPEESAAETPLPAPAPAPSISDPNGLDYVVSVLNRTEHVPGNLFIKGYTTANSLTGLSTSKATLRDYLGMIAQELHDPFVLEKTRANAWKHAGKEYQKRIEKIDRIHNRIAYGIPGALKKFHAFMDEMIALGDEGQRPHTQVLRDGIAVMQAMARKHRVQHAQIAQESSLVANLEDFHFHRLTSNLINEVCIDDKPIPDSLPPVLAHELKHFKSEYCDKDGLTASDDTIRAKGELEEHLDEFLRNNTKMTQKDYENAFKNYSFRSVVDYMQSDMARQLINGAHDIASTLGLNVRVSSRGK